MPPAILVPRPRRVRRCPRCRRPVAPRAMLPAVESFAASGWGETLPTNLGECPCCLPAVQVDNCCPTPVGESVATRLYVEIVNSTCLAVGTVYPVDYAGYIEYVVGAFAHFWVGANFLGGGPGGYGQWCVSMRCIDGVPAGTKDIQARVNVIREGIHLDMWVGSAAGFSLGLSEGVRTDKCGDVPPVGSYAPFAPPVTLVPANICLGTGNTDVTVYD